jgi:hypothetical protein
MPAVQLSRLKMQSALLADSFTRPEAFIKGLRAMLDYYANRSHRAGQSGAPPPLLPAYNVPPPVLKQVLQELIPRIRRDPEAALRLSNQLWNENNLECRMLATQVLARVPVSHAQSALHQVQSWIQEEQEDRLVEALIRQGLNNVRLSATEDYLTAVREWLAGEGLLEQEIGLRALLPLAENEEYQNLPVLFRLLTNYSRKVSPHLRPYLLDILRVLVKRSPAESAHFLRRSLEFPDSVDTAWLVRQVLPLFPAELQSSLREAVKKKEWQF